MNIKKIDSDGLLPIKDLLDQNDAISNLSDVWKLVGKLHHDQFAVPFFAFSIDPDANRRWIAVISNPFGASYSEKRQPGQVEINKEKEIQRLDYITKLFVLTGLSESESRNRSNNAINFEKELYKKYSNGTVTNIVSPNITMAELYKLTPNIDYQTIFKEMGLKNVYMKIDDTPATIDYFQQLSAVLTKTKLNIVKNYLQFLIITEAAPYISQSFYDVDFEYRHWFSEGIVKKNDRQTQIISQIGQVAPYQISELYAKNHFTPEIKHYAEVLVKNVIDGLLNILTFSL
jgi:predicted metalloendopeptidase